MVLWVNQVISNDLVSSGQMCCSGAARVCPLNYAPACFWGKVNVCHCHKKNFGHFQFSKVHHCQIFWSYSIVKVHHGRNFSVIF